MVNKIYLFRHGQTTYNRDGEFTGRVDARLTKRGMEDAKIIAKRLMKKKFGVAFHTSLTRSMQTLKIILKDHPECVGLIEDDRMIERSYGKLEGESHWDVVREKNPEKYDKWHRDFDSRPPGGESFADVEKRVRSFIKDLKKFMKKNKVNVAISSHGNSIRLFRKIMEKSSEKETVEWFIPYDKVYEYSVR